MASVPAEAGGDILAVVRGVAIRVAETDDQQLRFTRELVNKGNVGRPPTPDGEPEQPGEGSERRGRPVLPRPRNLSPRSSSSSASPDSSDSDSDSDASIQSPAMSSPRPRRDANSYIVAASSSISVEEMSDFDSDSDSRPNVVRPSAIEYASSDRSRSTSRSRDPAEIDPLLVHNLGNLNCNSDSDSDESDFDDAEYREFLMRRREHKRRKRMTSGSIGNLRTITETIGSDTDLEDLKGFIDSNEVGSSARRLRRKVGDRKSLQFQDPPPPRLEELEEPDSSDDEIHISETLARELPYYEYLTMEIDSPSEDEFHGGRYYEYVTMPAETTKAQVELRSQETSSESEDLGGGGPVDGDAGEPGDDPGNNSKSDKNQKNASSGKRGSPSSSLGDNQQESSRSGKAPDDGHDGNNRNRRRRLNNPPAVINGLSRLACPYQAYEPFQDCLQRGPRNPNGGCDGIYRLKQHLGRRHMLSFRCQTCWRSFDTKAKQIEHAQNPPSTGCRPRPKLESDRFMDACHESDIDSICSSSPSGEEETWWTLFRLLIPDMVLKDDSWLRANYSPYYITGNFSLTTPSPNFPDVPFSQLGYLSDDSITHIASRSSIFGGVEQTPQSFLPGFTTPLPTISDQPVSMLAPTLAMPIPVHEAAPDPSHIPSTSQSWANTTGTTNTNYQYDTSQLDSGILDDDPVLDMPSYYDSSLMDLTSYSQSDHDTSATSMSTASGSPGQSSTSSTFPTSRPTSTSFTTAPPSDTSTPNPTTTQLRLNNERLKARNQRAESENTALRDANRAARADITEADAILEELLTDFSSGQGGDPFTGTNMYESLLKLSKLMETASEKLRKAS